MLHVLRPADRKVEFIAFADHTLAYVNSSLGYPAYYPVHPVAIERPVRAVLMDLDGTSVRSEDFWIWIIQQTTASLLGRPGFELEGADLPFVSGHSVSEHLQYCIASTARPHGGGGPARSTSSTPDREMRRRSSKGRGRAEAFMPAPGLKEFLLALKARTVEDRRWSPRGCTRRPGRKSSPPSDALGMGDPREFYDAIITAGFPLRKGEVGTLGELSPKPHPWLYAETCRVGLGIPFEERHHVVGIEDSGAGVCSIRLAGFAAIGMAGGNIRGQRHAGALPALLRVVRGSARDHQRQGRIVASSQ